MTPLLLCFTLWRGITDLSPDPHICRPGCLMQSRVEWDRPGRVTQWRSIGERGRCAAKISFSSTERSET